MMRAERGNKEYIIDETMMADYQNQGYDIYDDSGEVVAYGKGKTVAYEEHMALKKENTELKDMVKELQERLSETLHTEKDTPKKKAGA